MTAGSWIVDEASAHRKFCTRCDTAIREASERPFHIELNKLCVLGRPLYRAWWEWAFEKPYGSVT